MRGDIILSIDATIVPGMFSQLEGLLGKLASHIEETEQGTLYCGWFVDAQHSRCHVIFHFANDAALLFHLEHHKPFAASLNALRKVDRVVCCGPLVASLSEKFAQAGVELFGQPISTPRPHDNSLLA